MPKRSAEDTFVLDNDVNSPYPVLLDGEDGDPVLPELIGDNAFAEWRREGEDLTRDAADHQWALGDWIVRGEELKEVAGITQDQRFKHAVYSAAANITGLSVYTIKDYAYVARNVASDDREPTLSFGHHKLVSALPRDKQRELLQEMQLGNLTVGDARDRVKFVVNQGKPKPATKTKAERMSERIIALCESLAELLGQYEGSTARPDLQSRCVESINKARRALASVRTDA